MEEIGDLAFARIQRRMTPPIDTAGDLFAAGGGVFVCRHPLSTALPIPLGIRAAGAPDLVTWAFAGLGEAGAPCGLLVLAYPDGAAAPGGPITVDTHYGPRILACPAPRPLDELAEVERAALCGAVLAAASPMTLATVARLFPVLADAATGLEPGPDAPTLTIGSDRDTAARLTGMAVPDYLLLRAGSDWSCARVARARQHFGREPHADLTLEPAWGIPTGVRPDRALLLGAASARPAGIAP